MLRLEHSFVPGQFSLPPTHSSGTYVHATYPYVNGQNDHQATLLTRTHNSVRERKEDPIQIMWSRMGPSDGKIWLPNHLVPLMSTADVTIGDSSRPKATSSTPTNPTDDISFDESGIEKTVA